MDASKSETTKRDWPNYYSSDSGVVWDDYEQLRPTYPKKIYNTVAEYMDQHNHTNRALCVDYGTGSGVIIPGLLEYCKVQKVLGTDLNDRPLNEARAKLLPKYGEQRFDTLVGAAGSLESIADSSVDLVTAFEACHWFDRRKWFREAARILKQSGTLAVLHYQGHCFIISHPEAAVACNRAFEIWWEVSVPRNALPLHTITLSATLLDSVVVDPETFSQQVRYKWLLPASISKCVALDAEYVLVDERPTPSEAKAGLLAVPDVPIHEFTPSDGKQVLMRSEKWTTKTILRYMETHGVKPDKALADERFQQCIEEIERVVGGPEGTFDVGWTAALVLATRR